MSDRDGSSVMWFLAGLGLGALVGVLYAPRSGEDTRRALMDAADDTRDYLDARGREVRAQANDWVARGKDALSQQKEQFKEAYQTYRESKEKA